MKVSDYEKAQHYKWRCENSLLDFTRYFFKQVRGKQFIVNSHHEAIAEHLHGVMNGDIKNLLINMPPRYGKTEMLCINFPAFAFARNPQSQFIHLSYSQELVLKNSNAAREIVKSAPYQAMFDVRIKSHVDGKGNWETTQGGAFYATQSGGAVIGFGAGTTSDDGEFAGAIIIDDPLKPDDARSDIEREKVNYRLSDTIASRRNSRNTPIIIVMQRLHEMDMSGFVLDGGMDGEKFEHLKLEALRDGVALWDMKHTVAELEQMAKFRPSKFATQYQQEPAPEAGEIFKRDWFIYYAQIPESQIKHTYHSWDTAYKTNEYNDPSCFTCWKVSQSQAYLADCINKKLEYTELRALIIAKAEQDKPDAILIEDKASGQSLIQDLRANTSMPIVAIKPENDKETRARATTSMFESEKIVLPQRATWISEYKKQLLLFPNATHDDMVDSTSQFINWWTKNTGTSFGDALQEIYR